MPRYCRVRDAISAAAPFLAPTQQTNLALLVSAILKKRTLCLSELARAYPTPSQRRVAAPKHDLLLHRLKRLWRFTANERVDALAVQAALVPHTVTRLGFPRSPGLAVDWTMFDTTLPSGERIRYQVLRIAVPRRGRALPLLRLAYNRDRLPAQRSQNQLEQDAILAVVRALPEGVRPVVLADRGFARASFFAWLNARGLDYVVRLNKRTCLTESDGRRWKLGEEGTQPGWLEWAPDVRYALYHGRPTEVVLSVALCWKVPRSRARNSRRKPPREPWYLATSLEDAKTAASWYWQRGWIEQSFKDAKSLFGLARVQVGCPERLCRLLMALTVALSWLSLMGLPEVGAMPRRWHAAVPQRGRASITSLVLALLDQLGDLPPSCLPRPSSAGG